MFKITNKIFKGKKDKLKQNKVSKINKAQGLFFHKLHLLCVFSDSIIKWKGKRQAWGGGRVGEVLT